MSDNFINNFLKSGMALVTDTKTPKPKSESVKAKTMEQKVAQMEGDPHKILIKRCIDDKISKKDLVEELKKFISAAEASL